MWAWSFSWMWQHNHGIWAGAPAASEDKHIMRSWTYTPFWVRIRTKGWCQQRLEWSWTITLHWFVCEIIIITRNVWLLDCSDEEAERERSNFDLQWHNYGCLTLSNCRHTPWLITNSQVKNWQVTLYLYVISLHQCVDHVQSKESYQIDFRLYLCV